MDARTLDTVVSGVLDWPVDHAFAAVVSADGSVLATTGEPDRSFRLASVTKLLTAYATLIAVEEGAVEWDQPAGPEGSTVRHLAAHVSGLAFDTETAQAAPGRRRIYSNTGFEVLGDTIAASSGIPFADYLHEAVCEPLGMTTTRLEGSPGAGAVSTGADLVRFAAELQAPTLVSPSTLAGAVEVAFPGLDGVLPGYGRQQPNDWGLGFELRDGKSPHWTGTTSSPATFGHFGQSGTFLWVDPAAKAACVVLTDRDFGPWAIEAWAPFTDQVLAALRRR
ncbi:serine hydrolase domain-containing protein [Pseudonocardia bannensis]|uniref:Beta-lactamase family protein n=1 Tax=Pseudonocardia bannensis TaxID=630973 RepID=A0A848DHD9_9PSEU|nr:serine hydrolase domain-containing protein [Pseudonocardia bannensis]NMH91953.1 beta-lactamase family protein [Pseudonocardia bannensis]